VTATGKLVGQFYRSLRAAFRRGGMDGRGDRSPRVRGGIQTPVAYLNCNFAARSAQLMGKIARRYSRMMK
jgi:hypothetical protein